MVKFCVLGSGSQGNAVLLMTPRLHVLIDAGFPPDELAARMDGTGASWQSLHAVILTHTHADHLCKRCLDFCVEHEIRFVCHERHAEQLGGGRYFKRLAKKNGLQTYDSNSFELRASAANGGRDAAFAAFARHAPPADEADTSGDVLRFHPIALPHDAPPTFGFRIEARTVPQASCLRVAEAPPTYGERRLEASVANGWVKLGYLVDLGTCAEEVALAVADVDLLALEFNHDELMERSSGRHPRLIQRVLSDDGHLSNRQAAEVFRKVLERNGNSGPEVLVQMHLSEDCNRAELAYQAAQEIVLLTGARTRVYSTRQHERGTVHEIRGAGIQAAQP